jgi:hypothetical protein
MPGNRGVSSKPSKGKAVTRPPPWVTSKRSTPAIGGKGSLPGMSRPDIQVILFDDNPECVDAAKAFEITAYRACGVQEMLDILSFLGLS